MAPQINLLTFWVQALQDEDLSNLLHHSVTSVSFLFSTIIIIHHAMITASVPFPIAAPCFVYTVTVFMFVPR